MSGSEVFLNVLIDWLVALPIFIMLLALIYFLRKQYLIRKVLSQLPQTSTDNSRVTEKSPSHSTQLVHVYCIGNPGSIRPSVHLPGRRASSGQLKEIVITPPPPYGEAIKSPTLSYS